MLFRSRADTAEAQANRTAVEERLKEFDSLVDAEVRQRRADVVSAQAAIAAADAGVRSATEARRVLTEHPSIKLVQQSEEAMQRFEAAVRRCPEVLECYLMTGPRDYLLRVVARDLADYERFVKETLTRMDGIANIESSFALGQVKHSSVLPIGR